MLQIEPVKVASFQWDRLIFQDFFSSSEYLKFFSRTCIIFLKKSSPFPFPEKISVLALWLFSAHNSYL